MSRSSFAAAFKQRIGISPGDYLTTLRLALAKQALLQGRPLKAVAPLADAFLDVEGVVGVDTEAFPSSFGVVVEFENSIGSEEGTATLVALGVPAPAARALEGMLFEVAPWDPATLATVALLLAATTLAASVGPATRASRVDPMQILRSE